MLFQRKWFSLALWLITIGLLLARSAGAEDQASRKPGRQRTPGSHPDDPRSLQAFAYGYGYINGILQAAATFGETIRKRFRVFIDGSPAR